MPQAQKQAVTVMLRSVRFSQASIGPLMWWPPWAVTRPWRLWLWRGADEWCNPSACLDLPFLGTLILFWRGRGRAMPCPEDWAAMDEEQRADYLPGGCMEGGRWHPERIEA